jgi:hypothetical protein
MASATAMVVARLDRATRFSGAFRSIIAVLEYRALRIREG